MYINQEKRRLFRRLFFIYSLISLLFLCSFVSAAITYKDTEPFEIKGKAMEEKLYLKGAERLRFSYDDSRVVIGILELKEKEVSFWIKFYSDGSYYTFTLNNYDKKSFDLEDDHLADFSLAVDNITYTALRKRVNLTFVSYGSLDEVRIDPDDVEDYDDYDGLIPEDEPLGDSSADDEEALVDEQDLQPDNPDDSEIPEDPEEEFFNDESIYNDDIDDNGQDKAGENDTAEFEYPEPKDAMSSSEFNRKMVFILSLVVIMVVVALVVLYKKKHHFI